MSALDVYLGVSPREALRSFLSSSTAHVVSYAKISQPMLASAKASHTRAISTNKNAAEIVLRLRSLLATDLWPKFAEIRFK